MKEIKEDWRIRFDNIMDNYDENESTPEKWNGITRGELLELIEEEIQSAKEEQKNKIRELSKDHYWDELEKNRNIILAHLDNILSRLN